MRKTMIIPTYWCRRTGELWQEGDAVYDHPTPVDQEGTLERTLLSMKQFHEKDFKLVILICPTTPEVEEEAYGQVLRITRRAQLNAETYLFTAGDLREMTDILHTTGLTDQGAKLLSMFGYWAQRSFVNAALFNGKGLYFPYVGSFLVRRGLPECFIGFLFTQLFRRS